jgi:hypothetical protein
MKKLNLILLLFLSCLLFSCQPKKEKKEPIIYNNNNIQNYKFDDEDLVKKEIKKPKDRKPNLDKNKSGNVTIDQ